MKKWPVALLSVSLLGLSACGSTKISCEQGGEYFDSVEYPALEGDVKRDDAYDIPKNIGRTSVEESSCLHLPPVNQRLAVSEPVRDAEPQPTPKRIEDVVAQ